MKTDTLNRFATRAAPADRWLGRWLPTVTPATSLDLAHWQSRAARGHTWNGDASMRRRHTH